MTNNMPAPRFIFAACQRGAEAALKREVTANSAEIRLAYSRPGYVTFKLSADVTDNQALKRQLVFARTQGIALGKVHSEAIDQLASVVWREPAVVALSEQITVRDIHVWQPDVATPSQHGFEPGPTPLALEIDGLLRSSAPPAMAEHLDGSSIPCRPTGRNLHVLDVAVLEPSEWWLGWHRVRSPLDGWPGGVMPIESPPHAVSRAYVKMEEALHWSAFPLQPGDEWVEIGCAPGGQSQALLDREQFVTGIDPAEVDPQVLKHPRFRHLRKRGAEVRRREFLDVRWLAADINAAPDYTLDTVEAIVTHPRIAIRGLILTLKLPDWRLADSLAEFAGRIRNWGYRDVRMRQLAHNGQEVCVVALRSKAVRRLRRGGRRRTTPAPK